MPGLFDYDNAKPTEATIEVPVAATPAEAPATVTATVGTVSPMTVNAKVEKNSRGHNWEVTVINAPSVQAAVDALTDAEKQMTEQFGS